MKQILVTGGAGFIGSHLIRALLADPDTYVTCIDNLDPFYDLAIKQENIAPFEANTRFKFIKGDILELDAFTDQLATTYDAIVHLAAKAGVRPSLLDPAAYQRVNYLGTQKLLAFAKERHIRQFVFASSSSVYGINPNVPWSEEDHVLMPISPYAASKVACELLGHTYSHLYGIRFIALRFFTVYGPGQRPDLAIHKFARQLAAGAPITLFGDGSTRRDYTYIDDIVQGIAAAINYTQSQYEIINLGNSQTIALAELIRLMEKTFEAKANLVYLPEQEGDVPVTFANIEKAARLLNYAPKWQLEAGLKAFNAWFQQTYSVLKA